MKSKCAKFNGQANLEEPVKLVQKSSKTINMFRIQSNMEEIKNIDLNRSCLSQVLFL